MEFLLFTLACPRRTPTNALSQEAEKGRVNINQDFSSIGKVAMGGSLEEAASTEVKNIFSGLLSLKCFFFH